MNTKQVRTLAAIFEKPTRSDIRWADARSLLLALGATLGEKTGSSHISFTINGVTAHLSKPHPQPVLKRWMVRKIAETLTRARVTL